MKYENAEERMRLFIINLPSANPLVVDHRFVKNLKSGRVHLTSDSCIPAVSMRLENREYTNDVPDTDDMCGFCRKRWNKHVAESVKARR